MKSAVIVFPASNCDRDAATALEQITGKKPAMVWHGDADVPDDTHESLEGRALVCVGEPEVSRSAREREASGGPGLGAAAAVL